jgi:hypothetical protein
MTERKKLGDEWKDTSISVATMKAEDIVHTLESTFPDVEIAKGLYQLCQDFWNADEEDRPGILQGGPGILNETIFEFLNDIAPKGFYFGAHPDYDDDFGFWEWPDCGSCKRDGCADGGHQINSLALLNPDWPRFPNCYMKEMEE